MLVVLSLLSLSLSLVLIRVLLHKWYFRRVAHLKSQVCHADGRLVPGNPPKLLMGNLLEVYQAKNQLSAYHRFHDIWGEIVQIFWMWRQQISISDYQMVRHILVSNQKNYEKYPPNLLLQRLYGSSILTHNGDAWKRHRSLLSEVFSKQNIAVFHDTFVASAEQLAAKWNPLISESESTVQLNVYPDLVALFLDIIGKTAIAHDFDALHGGADPFLENLHYILSQSTRPVYQFTTWWQQLPLPSNRKLTNALTGIDKFLYGLIRQRKALNLQAASTSPMSPNLLDLLLQATNDLQKDLQPLSDHEVRDNLLAIIVNGHETAATSVAFSLYLLAQHPDKLALAQVEVDRVMEKGQGQLTVANLSELQYLDIVINESLRLYPSVAGLQRVSVEPDVLEGWSIPAKQVVGITLKPLHFNAQYFGKDPEQFSPERYFEESQDPTLIGVGSTVEIQRQCPFRRLFTPDTGETGRTKSKISLPLTFGEGARKCLGEHFARYEMKVVLAVLLHRFNFQIAPSCGAELELGKFGLFITTFPKNGIDLIIRRK